MVFTHNWGVPGIDIQPPVSREGHAPSFVPLAWAALRFGPMGLYELRRRLGVPQEAGIFQRFRQQFNNADVAWFSGGLSIDGKHIPVRPGFFTDFDDLRKALPSGVAGYEARKDLNAKLQLALFDMATLWDRSFGGTTMVIHIDGTTVPNTPALPEYLRASVYLPPRFLSLHPA
ncbi:hypothetical protein R3P38DRAFT_2566108 [Favolaschia claudopus]|uniref:Uncharacterized protein n=1 Tax=Favolaschia claudopus TaxID=2862362 RepID=A0AAV9ZYD3_9AGAR